MKTKHVLWTLAIITLALFVWHALYKPVACNDQATGGTYVTSWPVFWCGAGETRITA